MVAWAAAVLCGGASRRMGRDKALVEVDGEALVRRIVLAARQAGAQPVLTVGGDAPGITAALAGPTAIAGIEGPEVQHRADDHPGEGPLGAVVTVLGAVDVEMVLVLSCDLLRPSPETMVRTIAALTVDSAGDVAVPMTGDQAHWLHAAWRQRARAPLVAAFAAGERSVHRGVGRAGLRVVPVRGIDPAALADADTPADL